MIMRHEITYTRQLDRYTEGSPIDLPRLKEQSDMLYQQGQQLNQLGEQYLRDKERLETKLSEIDALSISDERKDLAKRDVYKYLSQLQAQFDRNVLAIQTEVIKTLQEISTRFQVGAEQSGELAGSIGNIQMSAATIDTCNAVEAAQSLQRDYEAEKFQNDENIASIINEMDRQSIQILGRPR